MERAVMWVERRLQKLAVKLWRGFQYPGITWAAIMLIAVIVGFTGITVEATLLTIVAYSMLLVCLLASLGASLEA